MSYKWGTAPPDQSGYPMATVPPPIITSTAMHATTKNPDRFCSRNIKQWFYLNEHRHPAWRNHDPLYSSSLFCGPFLPLPHPVARQAKLFFDNAVKSVFSTMMTKCLQRVQSSRTTTGDFQAQIGIHTFALRRRAIMKTCHLKKSAKNSC